MLSQGFPLIIIHSPIPPDKGKGSCMWGAHPPLTVCGSWELLLDEVVGPATCSSCLYSKCFLLGEGRGLDPVL